MKKRLLIVFVPPLLLLAVLTLLAAPTVRVAIRNAFLQTNLDGNTFDATNFNTIRAASFAGGAPGLTNLHGATNSVIIIAGSGVTIVTNSTGGITTYTVTGSGGTPAGNNTELQFNDSSAFGADAGLTYDKTTDKLTTATFEAAGGDVTLSSQGLQIPSGPWELGEDGALLAAAGSLNSLLVHYTQGARVYKILSAETTLDFDDTAAQASNDKTMTVTGAAIGDCVFLGPSHSVDIIINDTCYTAWVSSANTVTVRFNNYDSTNHDPDTGTFRVCVFQFTAP